MGWRQQVTGESCQLSAHSSQPLHKRRQHSFHLHGFAGKALVVERLQQFKVAGQEHVITPIRWPNLPRSEGTVQSLCLLRDTILPRYWRRWTPMLSAFDWSIRTFHLAETTCSIGRRRVLKTFHKILPRHLSNLAAKLKLEKCGKDFGRRQFLFQFLHQFVNVRGFVGL